MLMRRHALAVVLLLLAVPSFARADVPAVTLSLSGPAQFDPGVPVTFGGALTAASLAGVPLQTVEVFVDGSASPAATATTGLDGTYAVSLTFAFATPYTHAIRAVANRGTPLETNSPSATITMTPQLVALSVGPPGLTILIGEQAAYSATGTYSDGSVRDVTAEATWSSDAPSVAHVTAPGVVVGTGPGTATIEAHVGTIGAGTGVTVTSSPLVINEVDYDQPGTDGAEFVELRNNSASPVSLDGLALVFVNGANNLEYSRVALSGTLPAFGYALVADPAVPIGGASLYFPFTTTTNSIQNGAPDGVALFALGSGLLIDALSYEGAITSAVINGFPGTWNLVEGAATPAADTDPTPGSLARVPDGRDTNDASSDWTFRAATPGSANA
jgi:hypothetical protein